MALMEVFFMSSNIRKVQPVPAPVAVQTRPRPRLGEKLMRNIAVATLVLAGVIGVREATLTNGTSVVKTLQNAIESEWDESLGRLTYVSSTLSESIQVFGSSAASYALQSPTRAQTVQAWSPTEPYHIYENAGDIYAVSSGEVMSVSCTDNSQYIVRILHNNGLDCMYYGLDSCEISEGDTVSASTLLGTSTGGEFAFQARRNQEMIDCTPYMAKRL